MSDINKLSVLKAFIDNELLTWGDFSQKEIFLNIENGTDRANQVGLILEQLENERLIRRLVGIVPPTWQRLDNAFTEYKNLTNKNIQKEKKEHLEFDNIKRDNWQKRNWLWLTIGGFVLGSIISPVILDKWKEKNLNHYSNDTTRKTIYDTLKKR